MEILSKIHPFVVHFPIALFVLYFLLETLGTILKKDFFSKTALLVLALGVLSSLAAVLTGNQAHEAVKNILLNNPNNLPALIEQHENYATLSLWYFTAILFGRVYLTIKNKFDVKYRYLFIVLGALGCVLIYFTGYFGGILVYDYGIGTKLFGN